MCVPHGGPRGIISQHPACHRLQRGGRAAEVTGRVEGGGRSLVGVINHPPKGLALGCGVDPRVNAAGSGERLAPGFPRPVLLTVSFVTFPKSQLLIIYTCLLMSEFTTEVIIFPNSASFFFNR